MECKSALVSRGWYKFQAFRWPELPLPSNGWCVLFSLYHWLSHFLKCHKVPRYPVCSSAPWTILSPWHLVWMKQTTKARADRNHKEHIRDRARGPPPCQWGRLERQAWPEWFLTISTFNKNGLYSATLRQSQSILSVSPVCGLSRIRMAWFLSVITRQPKWGLKQLRFLKYFYLLFHMVVPIILQARTFYVFQRKWNWSPERLCLTWSYTGKKWQSEDMNPKLPDFKVSVPSIIA